MPKIDYTSGRHQLSGRYYFTDFDYPAGIDEVNILAARRATRYVCKIFP